MVLREYGSYSTLENSDYCNKLYGLDVLDRFQIHSCVPTNQFSDSDSSCD